MNLLAIDPSVRSLGYAYFENDILIAHGTFTNKFAFPDSAHAMVRKLRLLGFPFKCLVIEMPMHYDSLKGRLSARKGDTLRLAFLCGLIAGTFHRADLTLVTAPEWKGQLPKDVTQSRLREAGYKFVTGDEADAIALGLWALDRSC